MTVLIISIVTFIALGTLATLALRLYTSAEGAGARLARSLATVSLFSLGLVSYFLAADIFGGDAPSHTARSWLFADILSGGELPIWTNSWYLGFPIGLYYGFFYYLLTATVSLLTGTSPIVATTITLAGLHAASGLVSFRLLRVSGAGIEGALFGALFFTYSFQHIGVIVLAGALPLSVALAGLPALLLVLERVASGRASSQPTAIVQASVVASLVVFAHIQYGSYVATAFGLVAILRCGLALLRGEPETARAIFGFLCATAGIVALLTSWFIVPIVLEKRFLLLGNDLPLENLIQQRSLPDLLHALRRMVVFSRETDWLRFYLGLVPVVAILIAVASTLRTPGRLPASQLAFVAALLVTFPLAVTSRFVEIWFVLAAQVAGWGVATILGSHRLTHAGIRPRTAGGVFILLLLAECSLTLVHVQASRLPALSSSAGSSAVGRLAVFEAPDLTLWRPLDVLLTGRSSLAGGVPQTATPSHAYVAALSTAAAIEVIDRRASMSDTTRRGLRMLNVTDVYFRDIDHHEEVTHATPAIFATTSVTGPTEALRIERDVWYDVTGQYVSRSSDYGVVLAIIDTMAVHPTEPVAERVVLHPDSAPDVLAGVPSPLQGNEAVSFEVMAWTETHTKVDLSYRASSNGLLQLAYAYYPFLRVTVDGTPVPIRRSALGLIVLPATAGEHRVVVAAGVSPLRASLLWGAAAGFAALLGLLVWNVARRKIGRAGSSSGH